MREKEQRKYRSIGAQKKKKGKKKRERDRDNKSKKSIVDDQQ